MASVEPGAPPHMALLLYSTTQHNAVKYRAVQHMAMMMTIRCKLNEGGDGDRPLQLSVDGECGVTFNSDASPITLKPRSFVQSSFDMQAPR